MEKLKKIFVDGKEYELAGSGEGGGTTTAAPMKVIVGRAIGPNAQDGTIYYFQDGTPKFKALGVEGHASGYLENSGSIHIKGHFFIIPEGWSKNPVVIDFFQKCANMYEIDTGGLFIIQADDNFVTLCKSCVKYADCSWLNCETTSPNFVVRQGKVRCIRSIDKSLLTYPYKEFRNIGLKRILQSIAALGRVERYRRRIRKTGSGSTIHWTLGTKRWMQMKTPLEEISDDKNKSRYAEYRVFPKARRGKISSPVYFRVIATKSKEGLGTTTFLHNAIVVE